MNYQAINISKTAWAKMKQILLKSNNKFGFLYSASSGGCNGFNFNLTVLTEKEYISLKNEKFLTMYSEHDVNLYIDPMSERYLLNTSIDYINEDYSKNIFESKFVYNVDKKLMATCGCGTSFNPKF